MSPEIVPIVVGLITAAGGIIAAWLGARALRWVNQKAAQAATAAADLEKRKLDRGEWEALLVEWRNEVRELRQLRAEDRARYDRELSECRARIDQLEEDRAQDRHRIRRLSGDLAQLTDWSRQIVRLLRNNNIAFPAPPFDLGGSDPRLPTVTPKEDS